MTTKEKMLQAVQELPDDASVEDAMERLLVLAKIERGHCAGQPRGNRPSPSSQGPDGQMVEILK